MRTDGYKPRALQASIPGPWTQIRSRVGSARRHRYFGLLVAASIFGITVEAPHGKRWHLQVKWPRCLSELPCLARDGALCRALAEHVDHPRHQARLSMSSEPLLLAAGCVLAGSTSAS